MRETGTAASPDAEWRPGEPASASLASTGQAGAIARDAGSEAQIARLFEMTSDLLATISPDGRFTLLNPAWEHVLGWTPAQLRALSLQELMHPSDVEQTLALMLAGTRHPARLETFTTRCRHLDGSWRWLLWSARCDGETWYAPSGWPR
jgi:PAS domain S-box-containing protein